LEWFAGAWSTSKNALPVTAICFPVASFMAIWNIAIRFNSPIDKASVATLPVGTRG